MVAQRVHARCHHCALGRPARLRRRSRCWHLDVRDGQDPRRPRARRRSPGCTCPRWVTRRHWRRIFTDPKSGEDLRISLTSFDVIVHTGELETFGQTFQEAQAPASRWSRLDVVTGTAITHPTSITGRFGTQPSAEVPRWTQ